jgi:hypothetical protein
MRLLFLIFILNHLILLTSCEVKETTSSGLISNHEEVENKFSLLTPSSKILKTGDKLSLILEFPFAVQVDTTLGTPYLSITVGSALETASYVSGNGTKKITFEYTVIALDQDEDGIEVNELIINDGTLKFDYNGVLTDCNTTIDPVTFTHLTVDNTLPAPEEFLQSNLPGFYHINDNLNFVMVFDEPVIVTGIPRIQMSLSTGGSVYATYSGGSGTKNIGFTYKITSSVADVDGYTFSSSIDLNGGAIKDRAGNLATLNFSAIKNDVETNSSSILLDGRVPYVTRVNIPNAGVYVAAQQLNISVYFNRSVTVTGAPYINLNIGGTIREANYLSGSGSTTLVFRYTTVPGDVDLDGIQIEDIITQNSGDIVGTLSPTNSFFGPTENNFLTIPSSIGILVSATQPTASSVTKNNDTTSPQWGSSPDNTWIIGQQILLTIGFNTGIYVSQTGGTPRIALTIGSSTKYASYLSGGNGQTSIVFGYTVQEGDLDSDGTISHGNIELNGGTITDSSSTNALLTLPTSSISTVKVDGIRPTISGVTAPANGTYSEVNIDDFIFTITWSEPVHYSTTSSTGIYIPLNIGGTSVNAVYSSGNDSSSTLHSPTTLNNFADLDGIAVSSPLGGAGTVKDQAGNAATNISFTTPNTSGVLVDSGSPSIVSVTPPAAGTYYTGQDLDFTVEFSESVTVDVSGGEPYLKIAIGNNVRFATVTSAGSGTTHTFRYTVASNDSDPDFLNFDEFTITIPGSSYIQDDAFNDLISTTFNDPNWTDVIVDEVSPSVSSASTTAGTYVSSGDGNDTITINLNFSEDVVVDTNGGSPTIALDVATGSVNAAFDEMSSTSTTLVFTYTIDDTADLDLNGLSLSTGSIDLNGATIVDNNSNGANLTISSVTNLSQVFIAPFATVWIKGSTTNKSGFTSKPTVSTTATLSGGYYLMDGTSNTIDFSSLGTVFALYMAIKTPASGDTFPQDLIDAGSVTFDNSNIDLLTSDSSDLQTSTIYTGTGTTHSSSMNANSTTQLELLYSAGTTLSSAPFISSSFSGDIAEIIIFEGTLSAGQKSHAFNYINNAYP